MNKGIFLVMALLLLMIMPNIFAIAVPDTNLLAYWKMDELSGNMNDSFSSYTGVNTGVSLGVAGVVGTAYNYTGSPANTVLPSLPVIKNNMAIAAWYKGTEATNYILLRRIGIGFDPPFSYFLGINAGKAVFSRGYTSGQATVTGTSVINNGAWHYIVGDQNAAGITIYVDGVLEAFQPKTGALGDDFWTTNAQISSDNYNWGMVSYSLQSIDEVSLWNRDLNLAEISSLYNSGNGTSYCSDRNFLQTCDLAARNIRVYVKDEHSWADLNNVAVTVNSISYATNGSGYVDINFVGKAIGYYNFTFTKDNYVTETFRYYYGDVFTTFRFAMLESVRSLLVKYKFKNTAGVILPSAYQTMYKINPSGDLYFTSESLTNTTGEVYISIDANDQRYYTLLSNFTTVYPILLTINKPKDEITDTNINAKWNVSTTNTHNNYWVDKNAPISFYVTANTADYIFITVDSNSALNYFPRTYFLKYDTNAGQTYFALDYLTPYLPLSVSVGDIVLFYSRSKTKDTIKYMDFLMYKRINGIIYQIMAGRTDVTGSRLFPFIQGENYEIKVSQNDIIYEESYLYTATVTPVWWYIDLIQHDANINQFFIPTNITFTPTGPKLTGTDTVINVTMTGDNLTQYSYVIYQFNDINMMTGKKIWSHNDGACSGSSCTAAIPIPTMDTNKQFFLDFNLSYNFGDTNQNVVKVYSKTIYSNLDIFRLAVNVRKDMGCSVNTMYPCSLGIIISVVLTLVIVFAICTAIGVYIGLGSLALTMFLLGIFTLMGWFYWPMYLLILVGALLAASSGFMRKGDN